MKCRALFVPACADVAARAKLQKRLIVLLISGLLLGGQPASAQLPTLGDSGEMSLAVERKLGDRIAREIYRDADYVDDPLLSDYVQTIWQPLQGAALARGDLTPEMQERFAWGLMLIRDRSVNAFALPGGYMGVHLGLIGLVASRDELASVLAHELSHVTQRHISRLTTQQGQQTPLILAAMVLGALAASKSPNAANAVFAGSQALAVQNQLNFSRDMEREADRVGYNIAGQAGFKPAGFVSMFEKLQQASRLSDNGAYPYLRSHPLTTARIADMQLRLGADDAVPLTLQHSAGNAEAHSDGTPLRPSVGGHTTPLNISAFDLTHNMMAARARILADPGVDSLRTWLLEAKVNMSAPQPNALERRVFVLYGAVLASLKLREMSEARRWLDALENSARFADGTGVDGSGGVATRQVRLLRVEVALQTGDAAQAISLLDPLATDRPELFLRCQVAVRWRHQSLGSALDARISGGAGEMLADTLQRLQDWVHGHPYDALAWQWLANVAAAQNLMLRALRAEAEVHVANLDLPAAVDRFKAAQDYARKNSLGAQPGDHIEASIIDTRLRQVAAQSRELSREQALQR